MDTFIQDIQVLDLEALRKKYIGFFSGVKVQDFVERAKGLDLVKKFRGDLSDPFGIYLIVNGDKYEVFQRSDRGGKEWLETYDTLEEAMFDYLDRYLCEVRYVAEDSKSPR